jgi:hypothetical protein
MGMYENQSDSEDEDIVNNEDVYSYALEDDWIPFEILNELRHYGPQSM